MLQMDPLSNNRTEHKEMIYLNLNQSVTRGAWGKNPHCKIFHPHWKNVLGIL